MIRKVLYFAICFFSIALHLKSQNSALTFNASTTYAQVANSAALNPTNITIEAWINATAWRTNYWEGSIVNKECDGCPDAGYMLRVGNNGTLNFGISVGAGWTELNSASGAMVTGTWYHVAAVYNGANMYLYINGAQVATKVQTGNITSNTTPLEIGRMNGDVNRYFNGKIDEVRIWNTGLTAAVISSWYNKTVTSCHPNYANLVDYYEMDDTSPATTLQQSLVGVNGTVSGATYGLSNNASFLGTVGYQSTTAAQPNTTNVVPGSVNNEVIRIEVETYSAMNATQFILRTDGTTNVADITNAKLWYTGLSSTFATTTQFGATIATPPAAGVDMTFAGTQALSCGKNYFWLTYDIAAGAVLGDVVDGKYESAIVNAISRVPVTTTPAGSRPIQIIVAPGGVSTGLDVWLKANVGVTGASPITAWGNQNASGTGITLNGAPTLNTTATTYNYNPYVDFAAPVSPRQYLSLTGYNAIAGKDYSNFFYVSQLNDLSRVYTHIATVQDVSFSTPANGTMHGDADNATGTVASVLLDGYDATDFGTGSPASTWQRNGSNILSNSIHSSTKQILSASSSGVTTINRFLGGQSDNGAFLGNVRDYKGYVSELITYSGTVTATQRQQIHSYLAIKYGTTLSINYLNTLGATIFTTAAPYNNNIIGIGRDDAEALTQKQSHNNDDTVRIYKGTLAAMNASNTSTFASNNSYVIIGANTGKLCNTISSNAEKPAGCGLYSRLEREWKVTKTNFSETFNLDIKLNDCAIPEIATFNIADLRLLVDDDGNFANGGTTCYYNGDGTGITFSFANPLITVTCISNTQIADNNTKFITIGSVNSRTPLPIELLNFTAECSDHNSVLLKWTTATETNNDHFTIERSIDGVNFEFIANVNGHGNSTQIQNYTYTDFTIANAQYYYRLKQTDYNGEYKYFNIVAVDGNCVELNANGLSILNLYPNPVSEEFLQLEYSSDKIGKASLSFKNVLGQEFYSQQIELFEGKAKTMIPINDLSSGVYFVQLVTSDAHSKTLKLVRNK